MQQNLTVTQSNEKGMFGHELLLCKGIQDKDEHDQNDQQHPLFLGVSDFDPDNF